MGAISMYREPGQTDRAFFQGQLSAGLKILDSVTMRVSGEWQSVFYAAVEDHRSGERAVWAFVVLINRTAGAHNFTFKDMDETVGPADATCPDRILDLLTPTDSKYAVEWRKRCRSTNIAKAARPKVAPGDTIQFTQPIGFTNGLTALRFQFVQRNVLRAMINDRYSVLVRVPGWRERDYEKVTPITEP